MSHVVIYRYRVNPDKVEDFVSAWSRLAEVNREGYGTLGSRLHKGDDGVYYAYSRWPTRDAFEASEDRPAQTAARALMASAIIERLPSLRMDITADFLETGA